MMLLIGIGCLIAGALIGALVHKLLLSDSVRVKQLEAQLQSLSDEHEQYRSRVHSHFSDSAQLLDQLTESYRDVYLHMADAARTLCPDYISNQLRFDRNTRDLLDQDKAPHPEPIPVPAAAPIAAADDTTAAAEELAANTDAEPSLEQNANTSAESGTEPAATTEPSADATAEAGTDAPADLNTTPATDPAPEPSAEAVSESVAGQASESPAEPAQEPSTADTHAEAANEPAPAPPLDYAPKATPGQKGNLAEDYGLDQQRDSAKS